MKRFLALVLLLACLLSLFGCSSEEDPYVPTGNGLTWDDDDTPEITDPTAPEAEQELVLMYYPDIPLNPYTCTDYTNKVLLSLIYQSLFVVDSDYNVTPMLCGGWRMSESMQTYRFYLVDGATFSDGTPMTIEDVYASLEAAMNSRKYRGRFRHVINMSLEDDGSVRFRLDAAFENFPILLDIPIVKATEVAADYPMGSGPYILEHTNNGARLRRRTNWWCDPEMVVTTSSIRLEEAKSVTQIRDAFEFTDVGLVCSNPGSDFYADYRCDYELSDCENGIFLYLSCNMESMFFSKPEIRSTLSAAIDRDAIVKKYYSNFAHAATLPASPLSPYYNHQLAAQYTYEPERFMKALSDNYLSGATIRIMVNKGDTLRLRIAREIGKMLEACGLIVEMHEESGDDYLYLLSIKEYDLYVGQTMLSANMDLSPFFAPNGSLRYGGIGDETFYNMCLEALANKGNYINLHKLVADDGRLCPILFQTYNVHATRGLLTGLSPARDNVFYYDLGKTMAETRVWE